MPSCLVPLALTIALAAPAAAHEERPAGFPDGKGVVPAYLGLSNTNHRVVCTSSATAEPDRRDARRALKTRNQQLLRECHYHSIQTAINSITKQKTSIYLLPGVYEERQWANAARIGVLLQPEDLLDEPAEGHGVHRLDHLARDERGQRGVEPHRPVVRRPATLRPQPQPDRAVR